MNEEWWGICAKGPPDGRGLFELYPRTAYYVLQQAFALQPYAPATDLAAIRAHFDRIEPANHAPPPVPRRHRQPLIRAARGRARLRAAALVRDLQRRRHQRDDAQGREGLR